MLNKYQLCILFIKLNGFDTQGWSQACKTLAIRKMAQYDINLLYNHFQKMEVVVHGTKICEGNILQNLIFQKIHGSNAFTSVHQEFPVKLNPENASHRATHRVDVFCIDDQKKQIFAFNSKGKSFNNTESQESLLAEYMKYRTAIERSYPDYAVVYAVLKDEYDANDKKMGKYNFLVNNSIPVYNTANYLYENFGISFEELEATRRTMVLQTLRSRMLSSGIDRDTLNALLYE